MKFKKKPAVIEAYQFDGTYTSMEQIKVLFPKIQTLSSEYHIENNRVSHWKIGTLEGGHEVSKGDWIIQGVKGEFYPCKPDIFVMTYEPESTAKAEGGEEISKIVKKWVFESGINPEWECVDQLISQLQSLPKEPIPAKTVTEIYNETVTHANNITIKGNTLYVKADKFLEALTEIRDQYFNSNVLTTKDLRDIDEANDSKT